MTDDELLKSLGAREREKRAEPTDVPLPRDAEDRIVRALLSGEAAGTGEAAKADTPRTDTGETAAPNGGVVLPFRRIAAWTTPLAVAAAIALYVGTRGPGAEPLTSYELSMVSVAASRATPAPIAHEEVTVDPDGDFELVARPRIATPAVAARALLDDAPWSPPLEVSAEGAVRITGSTRVLFGDVSHPRRVTLLVAREAELPPMEAAARISRGEDTAPPNVRVLRARVTFGKRP